MKERLNRCDRVRVNLNETQHSTSEREREVKVTELIDETTIKWHRKNTTTWPD